MRWACHFNFVVTELYLYWFWQNQIRLIMWLTMNCDGGGVRIDCEWIKRKEKTANREKKANVCEFVLKANTRTQLRPPHQERQRNGEKENKKQQTWDLTIITTNQQQILDVLVLNSINPTKVQKKVCIDSAAKWIARKSHFQRFRLFVKKIARERKKESNNKIKWNRTDCNRITSHTNTHASYISIASFHKVSRSTWTEWKCSNHRASILIDIIAQTTPIFLCLFLTLSLSLIVCR